jgi:hypothetical protein
LDPGAGVVDAGAGILVIDDYDMADEEGDDTRENKLSK